MSMPRRDELLRQSLDLNKIEAYFAALPPEERAGDLFDEYERDQEQVCAICGQAPGMAQHTICERCEQAVCDDHYTECAECFDRDMPCDFCDWCWQEHLGEVSHTLGYLGEGA